MNIPTIEITQQFGQIGMKITPPDLNLSIKPPNLELHINNPDLEIHTTKPEVIIDLRESFNSMGLQDIAAVAKSVSDEAKQTAIKGIERRVEEGTELAKAKGPDSAQLAARDAHSEEKQLVIGLMPEAPPRITATRGSVKGIYTPGDVAVKLDSGEVKGDFIWGKVDVYMEREPYIDIRA
ncbi:MAG: DUF6470 family protein [Negativicutes bacterium]|nr:DUF6470 family protein [Negativicutes bacterium]MDR3589766.1 DUF6470 family protein [Negativicutes bacterium]